MFSDNVTSAPTSSQPSDASTGCSQSNEVADNAENTAVAGSVRCSGQEEPSVKCPSLIDWTAPRIQQQLTVVLAMRRKKKLGTMYSFRIIR